MKRKNAGLTLLETLVALALLAVIAAGLASSLNLGVRIYERVGKGDELAPEFAHRAIVRGWLSAAASLDRLSNIPTEFVAGETQLRFVTFAPTPFAPDAAALRVTVTTGEGMSFTAETLDDQGDVLHQFDGVLSSDTVAAQISYWDSRADPPGWRSNWDDEARLPLLVRIQTNTQNASNWPEMTVRLQYASE